MGTAFQIHKLRMEEKLPYVERWDGDLSPGGEEDFWPFLQKNEEDFQNSDDEIKRVSRKIHDVISIPSIKRCLLLVS